LFLKGKTVDGGYSPKARFFAMHHTIIRTFQNRSMRHVSTKTLYSHNVTFKGFNNTFLESSYLSRGTYVASLSLVAYKRNKEEMKVRREPTSILSNGYMGPLPWG
jgi:hypothetical protein